MELSNIIDLRCTLLLVVLLLIRKKFSKAHPLWFIAFAGFIGVVFSL